MGKLRRFEEEKEPAKLYTLPGGKAGAPDENAPSPKIRDITSAKFKPEENNAELFQVLSLGSESSNKKISLTSFVRAMIEADGFQARAAAKLGIHYSTLRKYMKEYPKLKTLAEDIAEMMLDLAESKLKAQIKSGNLTAIQYYLNCKGRHRGWISDPKQIVTGDKTPVFVFKKAEAKK